MSNARLLWNNLVDTGTLTVNSEDSDFPKENIRHPFRTKVARTAGITSEWFKWDLATAQSVTCVALVNHNFDGSGTYKIQGNATDSWGSPSVDETITFNSGTMIKFFTGGSYRWWRLLMTNSSGTYIEVGRPFIGSYYEFTRNFEISWNDVDVDPSRSSLTIGGQEHSNIQDMYRRINLSFRLIADTEKHNNLINIFRTIGKHKNIFLSLDPDDNPNILSFYGRFEQIPAYTNDLFKRYSFALTFREAL